MGWGDLRFDHSDIFNPGRGETVDLEKTKFRGYGPDHPKWKEVLVALRGKENGLSTERIGIRLGFERKRGDLQRLLAKMVNAGVVRRQRESTGSRGQKPFVYYRNDRKGANDGEE